MSPETQSVITGGALAVVVIREVLAFLKTRKTNGHGAKEHGKEHAEIMAALNAIREDTKMTRSEGHVIVNALTGIKSVVEILKERR